nr:MAG TPA: hypothetical protein [Caudoviricetes sp.]
MTKELDKLIKELCQKEVERTGLPLVYDERETSKSDISGRDTLYIHQKMTLDLKGFDSIILTNQNSLVLENGQWKVSFDDEKFYGYCLKIERDGYDFEVCINENYLPTKDELIERLLSDEFRGIVIRHKIQKAKFKKEQAKLRKIDEELTLFVGN